MTNAEIFFHGHPSDEQLDRLRAELYDDARALGDALRAHLAACAQCRARSGIWLRTTTALDALDPPGIVRARRARRRPANPGRSAYRPAAPRMGFALAAVLALAIGVGAFYYFIADTDPSALAVNEQSDIYADIDFYLWLMQEQDSDDTGSSS